MGCKSSSLDSHHDIAQNNSSRKTNESVKLGDSDKSSVSINNFDKNYRLDGIVLGQGSYSVVKLGTRLLDNRKVAVKVISRDKLSEADENSVRFEARLLLSLKHPNIVQAFDFYEENNSFFMILEYLEGGELFDRLIEKTVYNESEARDLYRSLLTAVQYCHNQDIVHRDIKPENILLANRQSDTDLKLADFGFAIKTDAPILKPKAGTQAYVAPEIILGNPQGKPADMWSLGVVLFMLLGGYHPFFESGDDLKNLLRKITTAGYEFPAEIWDDISEEAKDLIRNLLELDTNKRFTINQALNHKWLTKAKEELVSRNLDKNLAVMKNYLNNRTVLITTLSGINIAMDAIKKASVADITIDILRKISNTSITSDSLIGTSARTRRASKIN